MAIKKDFFGANIWEDDRVLKGYLSRQLSGFQMTARLEDTRPHDGEDGFVGGTIELQDEDLDSDTLACTVDSDDGLCLSLKVMDRDDLVEFHSFLGEVLLILDHMEHLEPVNLPEVPDAAQL